MIREIVGGLFVASGLAWPHSAISTLSHLGKTISRVSNNWLLVAAICLIPVLLLGSLLVLRALRKKRPTSPPQPAPASPFSTPPSPYLESTAPLDSPYHLHLKPGDVTIGQALENDIVITQDFPGWQTVSRRHARIYEQDGRWIIKDLESIGGTYVNGRRTGHNLLRDGYRLAVGGVEFVFCAGPSEACPKCGHKNRTGAHFCQCCGVALPNRPRRLTQPLARLSAPHAPPVTAPPRPLPSPSPPGRSEEQGGEPTPRPLPAASVAFAPLPEGALLHDGQYTILEVQATDGRSNVYLVEGNAPIKRCPNCRTEAADLRERLCITCGADLSGAELLRPRYLMYESADEQAFVAQARLLEMRLEHPGLLLPRAVFAEAPYGPPRRYLVKSGFSLPRATALTVPQPLHQVLEWGVCLARALDHLHRRHVALRAVGLDHIAVAGKEARWTDLSAARVVSVEANHLARDVQGLAEVLLYLATGQQQATNLHLREQVRIPLFQALTAPTSITAAVFATALEAALHELRRPASVTLVVGHRTDVGQERMLNEDSLLALEAAPVFRSVSAPVGLFVVADGMGGHEAGDMASQLAVQTIAQQAVREVLPLATTGEPLPDADQWLVAATLTANQTVYERRKAAGTDMGTTLVMALVVGDAATIANVGDSRAYLLNRSEIVQVTTDHSLVERLVATGHITPQEATRHPQRNIIYRVIGDQPWVEADVFEQRLDPGEALLLCSDGLSGMVPDEQIWHIWCTATSPQEACDRLVEAANQAGGEDNITVVIAQVTT